MKKYLLTLMILSMVIGKSVYANEESRHKLTEEMLLDMKVQDSVNQIFEQVKKIQMAQISNIISSEKDNESAKKLQENIEALIKKEFNWNAIKNDYIAIYEEVFTEDEIRQLTAFNKTPLGQKLLEKSPEIMVRTMAMGKKRMGNVMPEVQKLIKDWITEQKAAQKNNDDKLESNKTK